MPTSLRSVGNLLYPPHRREYEDCKQILKFSLTPRTHKTPGKTSASTAVRRLALWAERNQKIDILAPFRFATLLRNANPLHYQYSLRSINPATAGCSLQKPTGLFAYRSRGLETMPLLSPQGKNDRLRYRSAEWTLILSGPLDSSFAGI